MSAKISFTFKVYPPQGEPQTHVVECDVPGVVKIGKLESSHLRIEDEDVSRMHAVVEVLEAGEVHIIDLGSAHGTMVNGEKIDSKAALKDGTQLTLGKTRVEVGIAGVAPVGQPVIPAPVPGAAPAPPFAAPAALAPVVAAPVVAAPAPPIPGLHVAPPSVGVPLPAGLPVGLPPGMMPQQAAPQAQAYVPMADPSLDMQDGSRAIEVTALFGDSVVGVRHLSKPNGGKVSPITYAIIAMGVAAMLVGIFLGFFMAQGGFGGFLDAIGIGVIVYGILRFFDEKRSPHYTVGESIESDLHISHPAVTAGAFPLVESDGQQYALVYTTGMSGDVTVGAERTLITDLATSGRAQKAGQQDAYAYTIPQDARVKLNFGEHAFLINSVAPARRVVAPFLSAVNWSAQVSNGISFAAHALLLFLVFAIPPDAKALSLDLFNTDNKFVKYLVKPPEQKEEEVPEWLKKKGPDKAGGKGQKHKGEEGKMGKKTSKKKTGLYGLKGPKNNPDPHLAKRLAENAAKDAGVLGLLKSSQGSHLASIFGRDSALGSDAEDALGGLIGDSVGESYGLGGLGVSGSGRGGGGTGEGTIGLGTLGTIGKGGGGGSGAGYGRGAGRLGGRRARAPKVIAGRAQVRGALDKEIIRRIIRRHINEVKYCYQKELASNEKLGGRVIIQFTISPTGQVVVSKVQQSTLKNQKVETCIARAVRRWLFPKPKGGGIVIVSYPFVLRTAGG
ncbi:MAG: AgmX/PglI C-terminal domain-containing protein [Deltaproteobacteria bacterium]|nr:AgmX/PglI C-terminal domain-containing protein [Deltaproteobacteria bacterium]